MTIGRISQWFAENRPDLDLALRPGATDVELDVIEAALGLAFPTELRAMYREADGQELSATASFLPCVRRFAPLAAVLQCAVADRRGYDPDPQREAWLDNSQRVTQVFFSPKRIPFAGSEHWDYDRLWVDLAPAPAGRAGQVIAQVDIEHVFLCEDVATMLAAIADGLAAGTAVFDEPGDEPAALRFVSAKAKKPVKPWDFFSPASARRGRSPRARSRRALRRAASRSRRA